jgi:2Fe-2S ferredoxin
MPRITVISETGEQKTIDAPEGRTLMEVIRDNGFDEMLALCGGCCSCATCHVHIDAAHVGLLPPISQDESDILDSSDYRNHASRLACQIPITAITEGLTATIAQAD